MLAFVDMIHALPIRGRKVPNSCFQGEFCIKGRKFGRNAFVQEELVFMHLGALFRLNFSCALLSMVSSPFASSWGVGKFGAFYLVCVEPLPLPLGTEIFLTQVIFSWLLFGFWSLVWVFLSFHFFFSFSELVTCVCCQCTHQGGDWGPERPRTSGWSLLVVMSDLQRGVDWLLAEYYRCRLQHDWHWCRWRVGAKGLCLAGSLRSGKTSSPDSMDPVASGVKFGLHGGEKSKMMTSTWAGAG
jgi:hypothetical protein